MLIPKIVASWGCRAACSGEGSGAESRGSLCLQLELCGGTRGVPALEPPPAAAPGRRVQEAPSWEGESPRHNSEVGLGSREREEEGKPRGCGWRRVSFVSLFASGCSAGGWSAGVCSEKPGGLSSSELKCPWKRACLWLNIYRISCRNVDLHLEQTYLLSD